MTVKGINKTGNIYISFLNLPRHRFYPPRQIEISKDGAIYKTINLETDDSVEKGELVKITTPIDLNRAELVSIKVMGAKKPRAQIGIDEIAFVP